MAPSVGFGSQSFFHFEVHCQRTVESFLRDRRAAWIVPFQLQIPAQLSPEPIFWLEAFVKGGSPGFCTDGPRQPTAI